MKEIYVDGYDTVVEFPDETPDAEIQKALASNFPETDDQFVNRIADPATPASAVSFEDFQRYQELKPELSWGDLGNLVVQGAGVAAGELYNGVKSTLSLAAQGQLGTLGASVAEGAARGTYDLASLGKRIQDNVTTMLEPYMQESGDAQKDQYNRFLAIKEMDNVREAARKGDATILQRFGIGVDPSMVDTESAEGFSYFLDPTVLGTGGSGKLASMLTKAGAKPAELAGRAAGGLARGISRAESKAAELLKSGTAKVDEMTGGLGKYAIPGSVGAAAYGAGLGVTGGAAALAVGAVPALELAEGLFKGFSNSMLNNPTRIGPMRHLAMTAPATLAGKAAGNLKWMDPALDLAAKGTTGAVIGSAYGAGLGGLAGGLEGAAQGLGAGSVLGAGTAGTMRLAEGVTGRAKVRAEENDYNTWRLTQNKDFQEFLDRKDLTWADRVHIMDGVQLMDGGLGEDGAIRPVQDDVIRKMIADQGGEGTARGFQTIEGERPVYYVNLGYDGYGKPISTVDTLFHEMFHGLARLDGFDSLVAGISNEIGKMYSPDEVNALIREYERQGKHLKESEGLVTTGDKFAALAEEIGAEYFANYIKGKDSSYLLKGTPFKDALNSITSRFVAGKLDRVYNTFQSEIFKHTHLKQSKGMDRAMNDLIRARRKAYRDVELSADDAIRAYGERDLGDDQVFKELQALGVAGIDNKGRRVMKTNYAIKKDDTALGKEVSDALSQADPTGGMLKNADGSWVGRNFSPAQIEALLNAPGLSDKVKEVIQFIDTIRKAGSDAANVTYAAATYKTKRGKTRYKNLPISNRDALIYGIEVSPVGTMIARILDLSLLRSKIVRNWTGDSRLQRVFGSQEGMYEDALTYINALGGDTPTATVLGSQEKRNLLNKLLGVRNVKGNPEIPEGLFTKEGDHPWRSFRLDRFVKARALENTQAQFSQQAYEKAQVNFSPSRDTGKHYDELVNKNEVPKLKPSDLVGMKLFPIKADKTMAGESYQGIDSSKIAVPIGMKGGPYFPLLKGVAKSGLAWANKGKGISSTKSRMAKEGVYGVVISMTPTSHKSNTTINDAIAQTVAAYLDSGRISATKKASLEKKIQSYQRKLVKGGEKETVFPGFPGLSDTARLVDYLHDMPFDRRAIFSDMLSTPEFRKAGFPSVQRILQATEEKDFRGQPAGQALMVIKLDPDGGVVELGKDGTPEHQSYSHAVKGEVVGVLEKPLAAEKLFPEHYKKRGKHGYYTLDRDWPVTEVTQSIAKSFGQDKFQHIKNPSQANTTLRAALGDWYQVPRTGKGATDFSYALQDNIAASTLTVYDPDGIKQMVKSGDMDVFQLGAGREHQVWFGLKRRDDGGKEIVGVVNNEPGAYGAAVPGVLMKAIEEGATHLDAFSVVSEKYPEGLLPTLYKAWGFQEYKREKFDPSFIDDPNSLADMKEVWQSQGWKEADGMPDVVYMEYTGDKDARQEIRSRYLQQVNQNLDSRTLGGLDQDRTSSGVQHGRSLDRKGRRGSGNRRTPSRNQGDPDVRVDRGLQPASDRFRATLEEILSLSPDDADNLRIPEELREKTRTSFQNIRFSPGQTSPAQSAAEIKQWAESHTSDQLRNALSSMRLTPTSKMLELIGSFPEYLNPVVDYVVGKRQALVEGNITPRDVAKAYWITLSSIGADAIDLSTIQKKASTLGLDFRPDEMFLSKGKRGQDQMRPEELAAWWLGTESGQKALNAIERGVIDMDAWEVGMAMRDAFGRQDFRPTDKRVGGLGKIKARNEFNLSNILPLTDAINKAKGDPKKLESTLLKVKGISDGKKGFIGHLLGLGDFPTIDAVELNVWLTGKGSTTFATQEAKKRVALAKKASSSKPLREDLFRRIVGRIKELRKASPEGSKIPESVAPHIIHHWIWDAAKGVQTTHAGLYHAMVHFSPSRTLNNRGGAVYTSPTGHRAVQTSSRAGVRVYDSAGKRVGPVFQSVEKAQDWLSKRQ